MRTSLAQCEGLHLMCRGRIRHWKDHVDSGVRQVTVGNPVFKAFNPLKCFSDLEVLAKEDHVNLFIPYAYLSSYDTKFCILENISFHGNVSAYTRSNGSVDFGINSTMQNETHRTIVKIRAQINSVYSSPDSSTPSFIENVLLPLIEDLKNEIIVIGDDLPTFEMSRTQMINELSITSGVAKRMLCIQGSRQFRRSFAQRCKKKTRGHPLAFLPFT